MVILAKKISIWICFETYDCINLYTIQSKYLHIFIHTSTETYIWVTHQPLGGCVCVCLSLYVCVCVCIPFTCFLVSQLFIIINSLLSQILFVIIFSYYYELFLYLGPGPQAFTISSSNCTNAYPLPLDTWVI